MFLLTSKKNHAHEICQALLVVCSWELVEARKDALDRARVRGEEQPVELLAEGVCIQALRLLSGISCKENLMVNWKPYGPRLSHRCDLTQPNSARIGKLFLNGFTSTRQRLV